MAAIQAIRIRGHEDRSEPKPHVVYKIEVQASVRSWLMWRRYSEFDDLHTELTKVAGEAPPHPLPPKHKFSLIRSKNDPKVVQERVEGLENYLRAIVVSKDDRWREAYAFKEFLGIPVGKKDGVEGGAPTEFTSASWLDEHIDLQTRIRDIRADINKRDALLERSDVSSAHFTNVQAKKKLVAVLNRLGSLAGGIKPLAMAGMSEGEIQRRTDLVSRLQDDCEKLSKMMITARQPGRGLASNTLFNQTVASEPQWAASGPSRPTARVFGSAAAQPKETEQTRPLDNHGVLDLQHTQMEQQDSQVAQLSAILTRMNHLGQAIGQEISEQIEILDELDTDVDRVGAKLTSAKKQLNRLDGK